MRVNLFKRQGNYERQAQISLRISVFIDQNLYRTWPNILIFLTGWTDSLTRDGAQYYDLTSTSSGLNPYLTNGFSGYYHLGESTLILGSVRSDFYFFYLIFR